MQDVLFVEHERTWPGSDDDPSGHLLGVYSSSIKSAPSDISTQESRGWDAHSFESQCNCPACGKASSLYSLFCCFDGHNGAAAAKFASERTVPILESCLPRGPVPSMDSGLYDSWRELVQIALVETIVRLNREYAARGILAGCTATVVLVVDRLVTCVNVGDSRATCDNGAINSILTMDHRIQTHEADRIRCEQAGAVIASLCQQGTGPADNRASGVGPLRIWPGGLCLSRAVGDFDVGDVVLPLPHLVQIIVPATGARLMIGSDGVWEVYEKMALRVQSLCRNWNLDYAPSRVIQAIVRACDGLKDDTSLIVVDITPPGKTFPECIASMKASTKMKKSVSAMALSQSASVSNFAAGPPADAVASNGGFCCFGGARSIPADASRGGHSDPSHKSSVNGSVHLIPDAIEVLADVDIAAACGLLPPDELPLDKPRWCGVEVAGILLRMIGESTSMWREAHNSAQFLKPATLLENNSAACGEMATFRLMQARCAGERYLAMSTCSTQYPRRVSIDSSSLEVRVRYENVHMGSKKLPANIDASVRIGKSKDVTAATNAPSRPCIETERDAGIADRLDGTGNSVKAGSRAKQLLQEKDNPNVRMLGSGWGDNSVHMKIKDIPSRDSASGSLSPKPQRLATQLEEGKLVEEPGTKGASTNDHQPRMHVVKRHGKADKKKGFWG